MSRLLSLPFLLPARTQTRSIRNAALRIKRTTDSQRALPAKRAPASGNPKRDPTLYGIPRTQGVVPPRPKAPGERPAYDNHPLWAFFKDRQPLTAPHAARDNAGRSWTAAELRTKSFEDLHKLWYIVIKERNILYSQRYEMIRQRLSVTDVSNLVAKTARCRKTMARIKYVLNERRRAAVEAGLILARERQADGLTPLQPSEQDLAGKPLYKSLPTPPLNRKKRERPVKAKRVIVTKAQRNKANAEASKLLRTFLAERKGGSAPVAAQEVNA